jgi:DNA polymerase
MSDRDRLGEQILGHLKLYSDLGVRWVRRPESRKSSVPSRMEKQSAPAAGAPIPAAKSPTQKTIAGIPLFGPDFTKQESLEAIRADLNDCRRCKLSPGRQNIVFGSGNPRAELMFVGEAPGADEDEQGLPFVGRAGQLLTRIIEAIDMKREEVYICNILKCRPPGNRNPESDEIAACQEYLFRQIASVRPKVICALGSFGAQTLLRTSEAIGKLRGRLIDYAGVKVMATFHPAYLLRNPYEKRKVWEDMQIVRDYLKSLRSSNNPDR